MRPLLTAWTKPARRRHLVGATLDARDLGDGVVQIRLWTRLTRWLGFPVTPYLVGDILVDTGFAHVRAEMERFASAHDIRAVCCTHHHEDHAGNRAALARLLGCPVYLSDRVAPQREGVARMRLYRRLCWGPAEPGPSLAMPDLVRTGRRSLRVVATPGHSRTHVAFFDPMTGDVFTGDLYVSPGVSPVMRQEDPYASIASLRRVAALEPARMLTGHGLVLADPAARLRTKADRLEQAAGRVLAMHRQGAAESEILGRLFGGGALRESLYGVVFRGEFSRRNFVRACVRNAPDAVRGPT